MPQQQYSHSNSTGNLYGGLVNLSNLGQNQSRQGTNGYQNFQQPNKTQTGNGDSFGGLMHGQW